MKKRIMQRVMGVLILAVLSGMFGNCGGSASSENLPPLSLPSPVAGLISVSSPDAQGNVRVRGAAGAVEANASVTVTAGAGGSNLVKDLARQSSDDSVTVSAGSDGSFSTEIDASIGSKITITQSEDEETSDETEFDVLDGIPAFDQIPVGTSVIRSSDVAIVSYTDGTDSFFDLYDLTTLDFAVTITVEDFVVSDINTDEISGDSYLVDAENDLVIVADDEANITDAIITDGSSPISVAAFHGEEFGVIGHEDSDTSLTLIDYTGAILTEEATLLISHPTDASASHEKSFALSADSNMTGTKVAVLSEFDNGDTIFSLINADPLPAADLEVEAQVNLGTNTFSDVVLYNDAAEALVTDQSGDRVIHLSGAGFASQQTISVGDAPKGIDDAADQGFAFVANSGDNTLSVIDLDSMTVTATFDTSDGIGLTPVDVAVDDDPLTAIIANQTSLTVTLFGFVVE